MGPRCAFSLVMLAGAVACSQVDGGPSGVDAATDAPGLTGAGGQGSPWDSRCHLKVSLPSEFRSVDILILFDGSESMGIGYGAGTRYSAMANALSSLVDAYQGRIRFGFMRFPVDDAKCLGLTAFGCCADLPSVLVAPANGGAIETALDGVPPLQGNSPTARALQKAGEYYRTLEDDAQHYILLATDGVPSCTLAGGLSASPPARGEGTVPDACRDAILQAETLYSQGVKTLVLAPRPGPTGDLSGSPDCLGLLAKAGGTAQGPDGSTNDDGYYSVADPKALQAAVEATFVLADEDRPSCSFAMDWQPEPDSAVSVLIDDQPIPRDDTNGWAVDPQGQIELVGAYCDRLKQFRYSTLEIRADRCEPTGAPVCQEDPRLCP